MQGIFILMNKHFIKICRRRRKTAHLDPKSNVSSNTVAKVFPKRKINCNKRIDRCKKSSRRKNLSPRWNKKLTYLESKTRQAHAPLKTYLEVD